MGKYEEIFQQSIRDQEAFWAEEVVAQHKDVAECAVIGVYGSLKGQLPVGLVVLKAGVVREEEDVR